MAEFDFLGMSTDVGGQGPLSRNAPRSFGLGWEWILNGLKGLRQPVTVERGWTLSWARLEAQGLCWLVTVGEEGLSL